MPASAMRRFASERAARLRRRPARPTARASSTSRAIAHPARVDKSQEGGTTFRWARVAISAQIDSPTPMTSARLGEADFAVGPRPSTLLSQLTCLTRTPSLAVAAL